MDIYVQSTIHQPLATGLPLGRANIAANPSHYVHYLQVQPGAGRLLEDCRRRCPPAPCQPPTGPPLSGL